MKSLAFGLGFSRSKLIQTNVTATEVPKNACMGGYSKPSKRDIVRTTGGDSSNKGCFGRKTNLFRESGDFAGNRETWEIFREI